jgi:dephospho-CoA kinase
MRLSGSYFGLTGGVASGKSTAARMFEALGARIIDADRMGHECLLASEPTYPKIVKTFGEVILDDSGAIDRRRLGAMVFADAEKLRQLNAIVHPRIIARVEELARRYQAESPGSVVVVDAALIFEAGIGGHFAKIVVAWCRPEQQVERLMAKTGLSRAEAEQRIASQMPAEEKRRRADYLIDCSGSLEHTRTQVELVYAELKGLATKDKSLTQS